jgi:hypothetical protein
MHSLLALSAAILAAFLSLTAAPQGGEAGHWERPAVLALFR